MSTDNVIMFTAHIFKSKPYTFEAFRYLDELRKHTPSSWKKQDERPTFTTEVSCVALE